MYVGVHDGQLCLNSHQCMFKPRECVIFMVIERAAHRRCMLKANGRGPLAAVPSVWTLSLEGGSHVREVDGSRSHCLGTTRSDSCCGRKPINASGSKVQTCPLVLRAKKSI